MILESIIDMPCLSSGVWKRFVVHAFHGKVTLDDMSKMDESGEAWRTRNPGRAIELVIIYPSDARMTGEERSRMASIIKRWEHARDASATVILATGLTGALHRSVLTGLQMIAPSPHPTKVFGATADAVNWLSPYVATLCGPEAERAALRASVDTFCARFMAQRSVGAAVGDVPPARLR